MKSSEKIIISIVFSILLLPVVCNAQSNKEAYKSINVIVSGAEEDVYWCVEGYALTIQWFVEWAKADGLNYISFEDFSLMKNYFECNKIEKTSLKECAKGEILKLLCRGNGSLDDYCLETLQVLKYTEEDAGLIWERWKYKAYEYYIEIMGDDAFGASAYESYVKWGYEEYRKRVNDYINEYVE